MLSQFYRDWLHKMWESVVSSNQPEKWPYVEYEPEKEMILLS